MPKPFSAEFRDDVVRVARSRHSGIGYLSPLEYENQHTSAAAAA